MDGGQTYSLLEYKILATVKNSIAVTKKYIVAVNSLGYPQHYRKIYKYIDAIVDKGYLYLDASTDTYCITDAGASVYEHMGEYFRNNDVSEIGSIRNVSRGRSKTKPTSVFSPVEARARNCRSTLSDTYVRNKRTHYAFNNESMSVIDWAKKLNVSTYSIRKQLRMGVDFACAIDYAINKKNKTIVISGVTGKKTRDFSKTASYVADKRVHYTYNNESLSINDWAKKLQVSGYSIRQLLMSGLTFDKVVEQITQTKTEENKEVISTKKTRNKILYTYKGKTQNILRWAVDYEISEPLLRKRLKEGMTLEQALTHKHVRKTITTTRDRFLNKKGYRPNQKLITYNNMTKNVAEWAAFFNMPADVLRGRINRGIPFEKATIYTPKVVSKEKGGYTLCRDQK